MAKEFESSSGLLEDYIFSAKSTTAEGSIAPELYIELICRGELPLAVPVSVNHRIGNESTPAGFARLLQSSAFGVILRSAAQHTRNRSFLPETFVDTVDRLTYNVGQLAEHGDSYCVTPDARAQVRLDIESDLANLTAMGMSDTQSPDAHRDCVEEIWQEAGLDKLMALRPESLGGVAVQAA